MSTLAADLTREKIRSSEEESSIMRAMSCSFEKGSSRVWISVLWSESESESRDSDLGGLGFFSFLIFFWILRVESVDAAAAAAAAGFFAGFGVLALDFAIAIRCCRKTYDVFVDNYPHFEEGIFIGYKFGASFYTGWVPDPHGRVPDPPIKEKIHSIVTFSYPTQNRNVLLFVNHIFNVTMANLMII